MISPYGEGPRADDAYGGDADGVLSGWSWPAQYPSARFGPAADLGGFNPPAAPAAGRALRVVSGHANRRAGVVGGVAAAIVVVVAVVVAVVFYGKDPPSGAAADAASPAAPNAWSATDCTHSASSGQVPVNGVVSAGGLSFPQNVAPGWRPKAEHRLPNSIDAISLDYTVSRVGGRTWIAQVTVGITNFDQSLSLAAQAKLMLRCVAASDLYEPYEPTVPAAAPKSGHIDGVPTAEIDATFTVTFADPTVKGDDVVIIVVGTSPSTYFLGTSPTGDTARRDVVQAAVKALHLAAN
ncbi:hypothetical protein [Mycobacterium branderi]|uniref:Uncharacterized protein n=1 Tax=Mycobacterium branderi TaxID=43348 RepID=A0A7I7WEY3_9MYCO|nr:hypothetical protein [Mycobacterium branderi]MCV7236278.1 hypothetical protein [Mycobacterium branderi]ORA35452.1 hypothetical protein BST20_17835 [Mycobacterium branderi]BBZ15161.1 hypothetical protein MBRA_53560 [Mycobacterium branderi]